jgi:hypothetical protein
VRFIYEIEIEAANGADAHAEMQAIMLAIPDVKRITAKGTVQDSKQMESDYLDAQVVS